MKTKTLLALSAAATVLAACGGGGGDSSIGDTANGGGTPGAVPSSAFGSVDAFVAYVRGLSNDETSEPLTLPTDAAPTSDTAEPTA
jgi:ABC-type glycerol-3-phosphate transport system substrate-binding protein